jgi:uncharacterized protein YdaU (DUF1376 family)
MTDEELIAQLKNSKGWPTLGKAAAARIEALTAKLAKAVQAAYEEGFLAGTADGWVNNPRIKAEWKRSKARTTLAEIEGTNAP